MSFLCALPLAAQLFSACAPAPLAAGYVEGDYVLLAPIEVAQVKGVLVRRGDRVEPGEKLVELEMDDAEIAVTRAKAALGEAEARLANLQIGKRPEEIAALEAAVQSARARADDAQRTLTRTRDLFERGVASKAQYDDATTKADVAEAAIAQSKANLAAGKLPAREDEIKAAQNQVDQAKATLEQAKWLLSKRTLTAPVAGHINDVIRNPGDMAGPSAPVLSMLPDGATKLTLYISEAEFSSIKVGTLLSVHCDGCPPGLKARVSYVSPDPEFTPPVIYSLENRQKLVYLVEARPQGDTTRLQPGQIVDVDLAAAQ